MKYVGLIPAAGKGTRLYPFPGPKELFPIGFHTEYALLGDKTWPKPVSQYTVERMVDAGVGRIYFVTNHQKLGIMEYYGSGVHFGTSVAYLCQDKPNGTAWAADALYPWIDPGDTTVLYGMPDTLIYPENAYWRVLRYHEMKCADLTLGAFWTSEPQKYGVIYLDPNDQRVLLHQDKPQITVTDQAPRRELMWGMACWGPRFTSLLHDVVLNNEDQEILNIGDVFDVAINFLKVYGLVLPDGTYADTGTSEGIAEACRLVQEKETRYGKKAS
jgi:glucose-1-phosphate thymidylyltransferase